MPIYTYRCPVCGTENEEFRRVADYDKYPAHCGTYMDQVLFPSIVIPDIEPYQAIAADKETKIAPYITTRSQHREFLRRNNYEELGNEPVGPIPTDEE